jgi:hypothetical protein
LLIFCKELRWWALLQGRKRLNAPQPALPCGTVILSPTFESTPVRGFRPLTGSLRPLTGVEQTLLVVKNILIFAYFGYEKNVLFQSNLGQRSALSLQKQLSF